MRHVAKPVKFPQRIVTPQPALNLMQATLHDGIGNNHLGDPVWFYFQLEERWTVESQDIMPGTMEAPLLTMKVLQPILRQFPTVPLANRDGAQWLLNLREAPALSTTSTLPEVGRITKLRSANDRQQLRKNAMVRSPLRGWNKHMKSTPTTLNRFFQRDTDVSTFPQVATLTAEPEQMLFK
jgi:hypothetical protein